MKIAPSILSCDFSRLADEIQAAEAGWGVTRALSYQVADALQAGALVEVLADCEDREIPVHLVYRPLASRDEVQRQWTGQRSEVTPVGRRDPRQSPGFRNRHDRRVNKSQVGVLLIQGCHTGVSISGQVRNYVRTVG